jgi:hypothetical protein
MAGIKGLTHWTSETVFECSEIAGSPHTYVNVARNKDKETVLLQLDITAVHVTVL